MLENNINLIPAFIPTNRGACFLLALVLLTMTGLTEQLIDMPEGSAIELTIDIEKDAEKENKKNGQDAEVDDYFHAYGQFNLSLTGLPLPNFENPCRTTNSYLEAPSPPPKRV